MAKYFQLQVRGSWAGGVGGWRPAVDGTLNQTGKPASEASTFLRNIPRDVIEMVVEDNPEDWRILALDTESVRYFKPQFSPFYNFEELPDNIQQANKENKEDRFVKWNDEYIPLGSFLYLEDRTSSWGYLADGYSGESCFAGIFIQLLNNRNHSDEDCMVWREYY